MKEMKNNKVEYLWQDRKRLTFLGLPWTFTKYSLTENRLFIESGLFTYKQDEVRLYRILDIQLTKNAVQRIFGLGTINLYSSDKTLGNFTLKNIKYATIVKELISAQIEDQRQKARVSNREIMNASDDNDEDNESY